ncbi:hypothetical protein ACKWTF_007508 [Chironomus riparius]
MKSFVLLTLLVSAYAQSQDLCGKVANNGGQRFADDPSNCPGYLWCNYNAENELISVHQGTCDTGFNFNNVNGACDANLVCDANLCIANTVPDTIKRIAVATDTQCRQFQVCTETVLGTATLSCTAPAVFNRNFGICTVESIAPCGSNSGGGGTPGPACDVDGFVNDDTGCDKFFFCENGVSSPETCPAGFHFNPVGNFCDLPENLNPKCETVATTLETIPKPIHINGGVAKLKKLFLNL